MEEVDMAFVKLLVAMTPFTMIGIYTFVSLVIMAVKNNSASKAEEIERESCKVDLSEAIKLAEQIIEKLRAEENKIGSQKKVQMVEAEESPEEGLEQR